MVFSNKEVIELAAGKKYIIVDSLEENKQYYYYVCEINNDETAVKKNFKVITTVSENGNIFVKTVKGELNSRLEESFKTRLDIE